MNWQLISHLAAEFPDLEDCPSDGLLAFGGDLEPHRLLAAYSQGIFPWYNEGQPILWWSPDPRCILPLNEFHISKRSLRKIRNSGFYYSVDMAFEKVISACAQSRSKGTWITSQMKAAYIKLYNLGYAHSVETWLNGNLAGGLYGVALGQVFCGESMFHYVTEASRAALLSLVKLLTLLDFRFIDCQQDTAHMMRMGAVMIDRTYFLRLLHQFVPHEPAGYTWSKYSELLNDELAAKPSPDHNIP